MMSEGIPMPEGLEPLEWIREAMERLTGEMMCTKEHLDEGKRDKDGSDFVDALMHLSSIVDGIKVTTQVLIDEVCTMEERGIVAALVAQKQYGVPVHVEVVGDSIVLVAEDITVPDSLKDIGEWDDE